MNSEQLLSFVVIALNVFLLLCFIQYLFTSKTKDKEVVKYIGGLLIAIVSLLSKNEYTIFFGIVIIGLIIASEKFMSLLIALFKNDNSFLTHENFIKMIETMSEKELEEKNNAEVEEINKTIVDSQSPKEKSAPTTITSTKPAVTVEKLTKIESLALEKATYGFNFKIERNIKMGDQYFDGVGVNSSGRIYLFEVKYIPKPDKLIVKRLEHLMKKFILPLLHKLETYIIDNKLADHYFTLLIILVCDTDRNLDDVQARSKLLEKEYNEGGKNITLRFVTLNSPKLFNQNLSDV